MSQNIAVIFEWQRASAVPRTVTADNLTPIESSSTTPFTALTSLSVAETGETASILVSCDTKS